MIENFLFTPFEINKINQNLQFTIRPIENL